MIPTADTLELAGLGAGCLALGAWVIVLKLALDDEFGRRARHLNGLLRIQSYTNLAIYSVSCFLALVTVVPFVFLSQLPPTNPGGDAVRAYAIVATRVSLLVVSSGLFVLAVAVVQCRSSLDRYQATHGPHNRRATDPPNVPTPPTISSIRGPI